MRMIAQRAGVTSTTVSLALRDSPEISAATKRRVRRIADDLGYQPDTNVSKLMQYLRNRRKDPPFHSTIAAITTKPKEDANPYSIGLYQGAERRAKELGYRLTPFYIDEEFKGAERLQRTLINRGVEGILLLPMKRPQSFDTLLDWKNFAVVATTHSVLQPSFHRVAPSHFGNTLMLCEQLSGSGYRRLGLVIPESFDLVQGHEPAAAVMWWNGMHRGEPVKPLVHKSAKLEGLQPWFEQQRPDAIIAGGIAHARAIARQLKLSLPGPIGFAVLNTDQPAPSPIAGGNICPEQVGSAGMDLLHSTILRGEKGVPELSVELKIRGVWVPGDSISHHLEDLGSG